MNTITVSLDHLTRFVLTSVDVTNDGWTDSVSTLFGAQGIPVGLYDALHQRRAAWEKRRDARILVWERKEDAFAKMKDAWEKKRAAWILRRDDGNRLALEKRKEAEARAAGAAIEAREAVRALDRECQQKYDEAMFPIWKERHDALVSMREEWVEGSLRQKEQAHTHAQYYTHSNER